MHTFLHCLYYCFCFVHGVVLAPASCSPTSVSFLMTRYVLVFRSRSLFRLCRECLLLLDKCREILGNLPHSCTYFEAVISVHYRCSPSMWQQMVLRCTLWRMDGGHEHDTKHGLLALCPNKYQQFLFQAKAHMRR